MRGEGFLFYPLDAIADYRKRGNNGVICQRLAYSSNFQF